MAGDLVGQHEQEPAAAAAHAQRLAAALAQPALDLERHPGPVPAHAPHARDRAQVAPVLRQRDQAVVVVAARERRAQPQRGRQRRVEPLREALLDQLADGGEHAAAVLLVAAEERVASEPAEQLPAVPAAVEAVAELARLGVGVDHVEHAADVVEVLRRVRRGVRGVLVRVPADPVVTGVVGEDRHVPRREVRRDDEHVVLEPALALREADPVLVEQRAPEQLVRREQVERRGAEPELVDVLAEQAARDGLVVADDLADHDVRLVGDRGGVEALERLGAEVVVVVDEVDELALRRVEPDVARAAGPARVLDPDRADVVVLGGERREPLAGAVRRAVVDEDQLVLARGQRLAEQRVEQRVDALAGVEDRHDHGHLGHAAGHDRGRWRSGGATSWWRAAASAAWRRRSPRPPAGAPSCCRSRPTGSAGSSRARRSRPTSTAGSSAAVAPAATGGCGTGSARTTGRTCR